MKKNSLLATRPNDDLTTRFISAWADSVISFAEKQGSRVFDLAGEKASKNYFESMIEKHDPDLIFLNGHGSEKLVTGQNQEVIIESGVNDSLLKGKITYALSCKSAKTLGIESVKNGATAYIGYKDDFIFQYSKDKISKPKTDKTAALFLEPSNQIAISLLKGHKAADAEKRGKNAFLRNIKKLITSQTPQDDGSNLRYLVWDMQNLACCE